MKTTLIWLVCAAFPALADWPEVERLTPNERIEIQVAQDTLRGTFVAATASAVTLRLPAGERSVARAEVRRLRVHGGSRRTRNALLGAAIGAAAGIGIGFAICPGCANEGNGGKFVVPMAAALGGAGAALGLLGSPYRTIYKRP